MANRDRTADKALWMHGKTGEDIQIHLVDWPDGVDCEQEEDRNTEEKRGEMLSLVEGLEKLSFLCFF